MYIIVNKATFIVNEIINKKISPPPTFPGKMLGNLLGIHKNKKIQLILIKILTILEKYGIIKYVLVGPVAQLDRATAF